MKKQTEYTFDEAKEAAIANLSVLAKFAESLHGELLDETLLEWAITLRTIQTKIRKASGRCLSDYEVEQIWDFGQQLIESISDLNFQLSQLWNLCHDVFKKLRSMKRSPGYALRGEIDRARSRIESADMLTQKIVLAARSEISDVLSPAAFLLAHIIRTETIEHALKKQLDDAVQKHGLQSKYDVEAICSVQSKVKKGSKWRTDVRAIRDAVAHGHFEIRLLRNDWAIEFDNNEGGYSFHKSFSRKEFTKFFDLHTVLYKLQIHLLVILELLPILVTHLYKQP